ncbi:cytochrome c oxidase assembly protein [Herbiconiux sp. UC225_62]|uniref:cytochrome c oxidase assembly protein n=1 Tax=Herbiconiux sp. UC225_62 TaxID=3350168 RepID=UPI0036D30637
MLTTWQLSPIALTAIVLAALGYAFCIVLIRRRGGRWRIRPTLGFIVLGLGSYAVIEFGFLGVYSSELRFAFTTRIALLLFAVPALLATGKPVELLRSALTGRARYLLNRLLTSKVIGVMGNAVFGPVFALAAFSVFLTPLAGIFRASPGAEDAIGLVVPAVGLLLVLPLTELVVVRTGLFIAAEFLLAFAELVVDAIPGIVLRLSDTLLDHASPVIGTVPGWFPSALRDQQLSGDLLWFIAEVADIPILILLFIRWSRHDRRETASIDELSDEEVEALTQEHLRSSGRDRSG